VNYFYSEPTEYDDVIIRRSGFITKVTEITKFELEKYLGENDELPTNITTEYQSVAHVTTEQGDGSGNDKEDYFFSTNNLFGKVLEKISYNDYGKIESRSLIGLPPNFSPNGDVEDLLDEMEIKRSSDKRGRLSSIMYPVLVENQSLELVYAYKRRGQLISLGTNGDPTEFAKFTYDGAGKIVSEKIRPGRSREGVQRNYTYNSPGLVAKIEDKFMSQEIDYKDGGYGQQSYGIGMTMQSTFNAHWSEEADPGEFLVPEVNNDVHDYAICIHALKRLGYLSESRRVLKQFHPRLEPAMPLVCYGETGLSLQHVLAKKTRPEKYGYHFGYGNHQELTSAKYFTLSADQSKLFLKGPFKFNSFSQSIPELSVNDSINIWNIFKEFKYITINKPSDDINSHTATLGYESILRDEDLKRDLTSLSFRNILYLEPIQNLMIWNGVIKQESVDYDQFEQIMLSWDGYLDKAKPLWLINRQKQSARQVYNMLQEEGYLSMSMSSSGGCLSEEFQRNLAAYSPHIPKIVETMYLHDAYALGESPFDTEYFNIDDNGNHRLLYSGSQRYSLEYEQNTNKLASVQILVQNEEEPFPVEHDSEGNVIKAMHKGITKIYYHPVTKRTMRITLSDESFLIFYYNFAGERILKQICTKERTVEKEIKYVRDEDGKVLADHVTTYEIGHNFTSAATVSTAYVYSPKGLLGFIRRDKFYSVSLDYLGSVRLVTRAGEVERAFDYDPYGRLQRSYGSKNLDADISYRFCGKEYDGETDLYNYHARLYDPETGRFLQIDPKSQYFSPYMYTSNSPVNMVDPDGEFAVTLLLCGGLGLAGAYLEGAAANNRKNPLVWDFKDTGKYNL